MMQLRTSVAVLGRATSRCQHDACSAHGGTSGRLLQRVIV